MIILRVGGCRSLLAILQNQLVELRDRPRGKVWPISIGLQIGKTILGGSLRHKSSHSVVSQFILTGTAPKRLLTNTFVDRLVLECSQRVEKEIYSTLL